MGEAEFGTREKPRSVAVIVFRPLKTITPSASRAQSGDRPVVERNGDACIRSAGDDGQSARAEDAADRTMAAAVVLIRHSPIGSAFSARIA